MTGSAVNLAAVSFTIFAILCVVGCSSETDSATTDIDNNTLPIENLGTAIGITPNNHPYLEFHGGILFSYTTNASRFTVNAKTKKGNPIASLEGRIWITDYERDIFTLECDITTTQDFDLKILGAKSIDSTHQFDEQKSIRLESGKHAIEATIIFEHVYKWDQ